MKKLSFYLCDQKEESFGTRIDHKVALQIDILMLLILKHPVQPDLVFIQICIVIPVVKE